MNPAEQPTTAEMRQIAARDRHGLAEDLPAGLLVFGVLFAAGALIWISLVLINRNH